MDYVEVITQSIESALEEKSKLNDKVFQINGFSSNRILHLFNNIASKVESLNYLEIGLLYGRTFVATLYNNHNVNMGYGVEDFSEFNGDTSVLKENLKVLGDIPVQIFIEDCFKLDLSKIKDKINFYFYDGNHTEEGQFKALEYYYPILADTFICCIDDYNWDKVRTGTEKALSLFNIIKDWTFLTDDIKNGNTWWNGLYIAVLNKKKKRK